MLYFALPKHIIIVFIIVFIVVIMQYFKNICLMGEKRKGGLSPCKIDNYE